MNCKSVVIVIIVLLLSIVVLNNLFSNDFILGGFVYNKNNFDWNSSLPVVAGYLHTAGYNTCISKALDDASTAPVIEMVSILQNDSINCILEDFVFDPNIEAYGARTLSSGNYFRFEAEYHDADSISNFDIEKPDNFFYVSSDDSIRIGNHNFDIVYSNQYYWQVDDGEQGYAYHDVTYKWPMFDNPLNYFRIGQEFRFPYRGLKTNDHSFFDSNWLYITFAMNVEGINNLSDDAILADIRFTNKGETTNETDSTNVYHYTSDSSDPVLVTHITKGMYNSSPSVRDSLIHMITVHIRPEQMTWISHGQNWDKVFNNLNPTLYWHGQGRLKLDYIEFNDKLYKDFTNNDVVLQKMIDDRSFGLDYLVGLDEPQPGQFSSFDRISRYLEQHNPTLEIITPVHNYKNQVKKSDGEPFNNRKAFIDTAKPKSIMINEYPFNSYVDHIDWINSGAVDFVQKYIDRVCNEYKKNRLICADSIKFIAVPQTWGKWEHSSLRWNYLLPPDKVARSLQLLPLCYKAQGIIDFTFLSPSDVNSDPIPEFALLNKNSTGGWYTTPQYEEVKDANGKILEYGSKILENTWLGAGSIMTTASYGVPGAMLDSLKVMIDPNSNLYQGYVQAGFYSDGDNVPQIMLVNRRAILTDVDLHSVSPLGHPDPLVTYNNSYTSAPPQSVLLYPDSQAMHQIGSYIGFFDSDDDELYFSNDPDNQIVVPIGPGDGKLLEMVATLPDSVSSDAFIYQKGFIKGHKTINNNAVVTFGNASDVTLFDSTTVVIASGSKLIILGDFNIGFNTKIIVEDGGELSFIGASGVFSYFSGILQSGGLLKFIDCHDDKVCPALKIQSKTQSL